MGELVPLHDPQDTKRAIRRIRRLWNDGAVEIHGHAADRMLERGIDVHDIKSIIEGGRITEISRPMTLWRYKVTGKTVDGLRAACIVEIDGGLIILTVVDLTIPREKRGRGSP